MLGAMLTDCAICNAMLWLYMKCTNETAQYGVPVFFFYKKRRKVLCAFAAPLLYCPFRQGLKLMLEKYVYIFINRWVEVYWSICRWKRFYDECECVYSDISFTNKIRSRHQRETNERDANWEALTKKYGALVLLNLRMTVRNYAIRDKLCGTGVSFPST